VIYVHPSVIDGYVWANISEVEKDLLILAGWVEYTPTLDNGGITRVITAGSQARIPKEMIQ